MANEAPATVDLTDIGFIPVKPENKPVSIDLSDIGFKPVKSTPHTFASTALKDNTGAQPTETGINPLNIAKGVALQGGLATAGGIIGAAGGPFAPMTIPAGAFLGGTLGNVLQQETSPGYDANKPGLGIKKGEALASGAVSMIPGGGANGDLMALAKEGIKQGAGGIAAKTLETGVDEGRLPTAREAILASTIPAAFGAVAQKVQSLSPANQAAVAAATKNIPIKTQTLKAAQDEGYVIAPSSVNDSGVNKQIESVAGKAAVGQAASVKNQEVTDSLAKRAIGVPDETPLNLKVLNDVREQASEPYQKIADLSKDSNAIQAVALVNPPAAKNIAEAATNLSALRQARFDANVYGKHYQASADPASLKLAQTNRDLADELEGKLEDAAKFSGNPKLVDELRGARAQIAKTYDVENALNLGDGHVSAPIIGRLLDKGRPLTGDLKTIGEFAQAFPAVVREGASIPSPGVSKVGAALSLLSGLEAGTTHGIGAGMLAGAVPLVASPLARNAVLSRPYQNLFARLPEPNIAGITTELANAILRLSQATGQQSSEKN